ncbi:MAG: RdgB/HAM1 family non-canonical purine NTP pyrophosphatase [Bdellovibrionota bacterium]|jgi:XTP/dITP diphosphohydrolase
MAEKEFVFATANKGKLEEMQAIATRFNIKVLSPLDLVQRGLQNPPDVEETADTYEGNAKLKADAISKWSGLPAIADDTGLEVAALNGAPGLLSARYAGDPCTPADNRKKLLSVLDGEKNRKAQFRSVICFSNGGEVKYFYGVLNGSITTAEYGSGGFGYDSIFLVDGYNETLAQLKGKGSPVKTHRVQALEEFFNSDFIK